MNILKPAAVIAVGLVALAACQKAAVVDTAAIETELKSGTRAWLASYNAGDADAIAARYSDDAVVMSPGAPAAIGREAIRALIAEQSAAAKAAGMTLAPIDGDTAGVSLSGDMAWHSGAYTVSDASGAVVDSGNYMEVQKNMDGKWLIIRDIWNSDRPPVAAAAAPVAAPAAAPAAAAAAAPVAATAAAPAAAPTDKYTETAALFRDAGQSASFFDKSYGYAVFPTIGKAGLGIGGARGSGRVYEKGTYVGDSSMTQLSLGFQAGGEAFSQIVFFEDKRAFDEFTSGNFEFGANVSAVVITAAASGTAATTGSSGSASGGKKDATTAGKYHKGTAVFIIVKGGLMYEASVSGQKFKYKPLAK